MNAFRLQNLPALFAAVSVAAFIATNTAYAFSIDPQSGTNADGSAKYVDPDEQFENFTSKNAFGFGNGFFNLDFRPFFGANSHNSQFGSGYRQDRITPDH